MAIKVAILKSGEQVIADVNGMFRSLLTETNEESLGELVKYQFVKPCQVIINGEFRITEPNEETKQNKMSVSLYPWPALTKDTEVEVNTDWVVTLVNPTDELKKMYEEQVLENGTGSSIN